MFVSARAHHQVVNPRVIILNASPRAAPVYVQIHISLVPLFFSLARIVRQIALTLRVPCHAVVINLGAQFGTVTRAIYLLCVRYVVFLSLHAAQVNRELICATTE
jgi:hypothetical protein